MCQYHYSIKRYPSKGSIGEATPDDFCPQRIPSKVALMVSTLQSFVAMSLR